MKTQQHERRSKAGPTLPVQHEIQHAWHGMGMCQTQFPSTHLSLDLSAQLFLLLLLVDHYQLLRLLLIRLENWPCRTRWDPKVRLSHNSRNMQNTVPQHVKSSLQHHEMQRLQHKNSMRHSYVGHVQYVFLRLKKIIRIRKVFATFQIIPRNTFLIISLKPM